MVVGATVVFGMVVGRVVVGGTNVDEVGGGSVVGVVTSVVGVGVVVAGGGEVAGGALVPTLRAAVVTTAGWVTPEPPDGMVATVVVLESTGEEVDVEAFDVVVGPEVVEVRRTVVVVGD